MVWLIRQICLTPARRLNGLMPPLLRSQVTASALALSLCLVAMSACSAPDSKALKKLACEQAAASVDLESLAQLDSLRKALGVARDVDPILACKALGAVMGLAKQTSASTAQELSGPKAQDACIQDKYGFFSDACAGRPKSQIIQPSTRTEAPAPANLVHPPLCFPRC